MVTEPADHRRAPFLWPRLRPSGAMTPVDAILEASFEHRVLSNHNAAIDYPDYVR